MSLLTLPSSLMNLGGKSRSGLFGTFLMGLTVGIIAAPCIGPFVLGLLAFVGERQDPLLGFSMFFVLALGLGLPFVFLAIFSGSISSLPRSGDWMVWVRKVFGIILLLMALYFLRPLLPEGMYGLLTSVFMVLSGLYLFIAKVKNAKVGFWIAKGLVAVAFIGAGLFIYSTSMQHHAPTEAIVWKAASMENLDAALGSGRPVVLEFSAEWCVPCKELEHFTFTDKEAIKTSARFEMIKVDLTKSADPVAGSIKDRFKISGVPTIMFFGRDGKLRNNLTAVGFIDAEKFVEKMNAAEGE
jgi:thiol:disulfide interchange protein DsbD